MLDSVEPSAQPQARVRLATSIKGRVADGVGLRQGNFEERWEAAKQIPALGAEAITELMALLSEEALPWETRWFAARSLGNFDAPEVVATLIEVLCATPDDDLREAIIQALTQIGPNAILALSHLLPQAAHRAGAVYALARIPHPDTQAPLLEAFALTQGLVRAQVVEALAQFADPNLLPVITQALTDPASPVRLAAIQGLINLKKYLDDHQWVDWLTPCLGDLHPAVARQAVYALGRSPDARSTTALEPLLKAASTPEPLKIATVQALTWQATSQALATLTDAWPTLSPAVQIAAIQGLSRLADTTLKPHLSDQVQQWLAELPPTAENSLLRRNLVMLLGQIGDDQVIPVLQSLSRDADAGVRIHAEAILCSNALAGG